MSPSRRLEHRDYASHGRYFVTVCSNFKRTIFGEVYQESVLRTPLGEIAEQAWANLAALFPEIRLHGHVVMPNHIHGVVEIIGARQAHSLSVIVRTFKANVTRRARIELGWAAGIWQQNYYDRVIRDDREFLNATRYIAENPARWQGRASRWEENAKIKNE